MWKRPHCDPKLIATTAGTGASQARDRGHYKTSFHLCEASGPFRAFQEMCSMAEEAIKAHSVKVGWELWS